jgi:hypothetical protein
LSLEEIEGRWLSQLLLPTSCLCGQPSIGLRRPRAGGATSTSTAPASIRVHSAFLVQSMYGAIQEYGGFERPQWLD